MSETTIRQIIPAAGWSVEFDQGNGRECQPLIAWALQKNGAVSGVMDTSCGCLHNTGLAGIYVTIEALQDDGLIFHRYIPPT